MRFSWFPPMFENKVGRTPGTNNLSGKDPPACFIF